MAIAQSSASQSNANSGRGKTDRAANARKTDGERKKKEKETNKKKRTVPRWTPRRRDHSRFARRSFVIELDVRTPTVSLERVYRGHDDLSARRLLFILFFPLRVYATNENNDSVHEQRCREHDGSIVDRSMNRVRCYDDIHEIEETTS